ncbi:MAG: YetF domain-containing protein [Pseudomonadota bacterium]
MSDWFTIPLDAAILLPLLMAFVRVAGLRSFAKMSAHDFAVTVAMGSVVAATVLDPEVPWWTSALALAALLAMQSGIGAVRAWLPRVQRWTDNEPLVLMADGQVRDDALRHARLTRDDLRQKLRQAGVSRMADAALVVLETTGDVSVLGTRPDADLVAEVRGIADAPEKVT